VEDYRVPAGKEARANADALAAHETADPGGQGRHPQTRPRPGLRSHLALLGQAAWTGSKSRRKK